MAKKKPDSSLTVDPNDPYGTIAANEEIDARVNARLAEILGSFQQPQGAPGGLSDYTRFGGDPRSQVFPGGFVGGAGNTQPIGVPIMGEAPGYKQYSPGGTGLIFTGGSPFKPDFRAQRIQNAGILARELVPALGRLGQNQGPQLMALIKKLFGGQ